MSTFRNLFSKFEVRKFRAEIQSIQLLVIYKFAVLRHCLFCTSVQSRIFAKNKERQAGVIFCPYLFLLFQQQ
jgi:hypothetical protein